VPQGFVDKYHFSKKWFYLYGEAELSPALMHHHSKQQQRQRAFCIFPNRRCYIAAAYTMLLCSGT
jgi:hypothetical protein